MPLLELQMIKQVQTLLFFEIPLANISPSKALSQSELEFFLNTSSTFYLENLEQG